ncbi:MAG: MotA/TolQ/ExbB proton channel family protein [Deltaproteobacteria bacterium]|nr:MotA/TolQ/ExbB proton channel family protein [Deltaproteobacteria bacterium]
MLTKLFLGISLVGAEWVLYALVLLSIVSIALILERAWFYSKATKGLDEFRERVRSAASHKNWEDVKKVTLIRNSQLSNRARDLDSGVVEALLSHQNSKNIPSLEALSEMAQDAMIRVKLDWERNLAFLATIGSNAPFIGLFGTVLGIIKAFHDLSQQAASGAQTVTSGISEALVATAIGLMVAIPAVISFNLFQRRVRSALAEAEALKSFLMSKLVE